MDTLRETEIYSIGQEFGVGVLLMFKADKAYINGT